VHGDRFELRNALHCHTPTVVRNLLSTIAMIDKSKLPEQTYNELIDLLGYDKAEEFLTKNGYFFRIVQCKIISEQMKRKYGKRIWIYIWIVGFILAIIFAILKHYMII
jgi:uncharacterized membrane protein YfhO